MRDHDLIRAELEGLRETAGLLRPDKVVKFARDPKTALHACFTWDDKKASERWRIEEARRLIRVYVEVEEGKDEAPVRAFVSLSTDRANKGGYRAMVDVLQDPELYSQLLADALKESERFREKYKKLKEMQPVLKAMDKVARQQSAKHSEHQVAA